MRMVVKIKGLDEMSAQIDAMRERVEDIEPVMKGRASAFETMIAKDVFASEVSPAGTGWPDLADSTKDRRRKPDAPMKILQDTGRLKKSVFARATARGMVFGVSDLEGKANAHLFGVDKMVTAKSRKTGLAGASYRMRIPARPYLPVDRDGSPDFSTGAALKWYERLRDRLKRWVEQGTL